MNRPISSKADQTTKTEVLWIERALWISKDYEPTTQRNWREDIVWSSDSVIIAVLIEGEFVYAFDISEKVAYEGEPEQIQDILQLHSNLKP